MDLDVAFEHVDGVRVLDDCAALLVRLDVNGTARCRPTVKRPRFKVFADEL